MYAKHITITVYLLSAADTSFSCKKFFLAVCQNGKEIIFCSLLSLPCMWAIKLWFSFRRRSRPSESRLSLRKNWSRIVLFQIGSGWGLATPSGKSKNDQFFLLIKSKLVFQKTDFAFVLAMKNFLNVGCDYVEMNK